jgi:hypothetical protein
MTNDQQSQHERAGVEGLTPTSGEPQSYDATRDPRTGRPPNPLEAQKLAREHEAERLRNNPPDTTVPEWQEPARMTSPKTDDDDMAAVDALVEEGLAREQAEELVKAHGSNWETLKTAAFPDIEPASSQGEEDGEDNKA